jgi:hypothetical protein
LGTGNITNGTLKSSSMIQNGEGNEGCAGGMKMSSARSGLEGGRLGGAQHLRRNYFDTRAIVSDIDSGHREYADIARRNLKRLTCKPFLF